LLITTIKCFVRLTAGYCTRKLFMVTIV